MSLPSTVCVSFSVADPCDQTSYVYDDDKYEETCALIDGTTTYALTGCV